MFIRSFICYNLNFSEGDEARGEENRQHFIQMPILFSFLHVFPSLIKGAPFQIIKLQTISPSKLKQLNTQ